jgi:hypothetical protein
MQNSNLLALGVFLLVFFCLATAIMVARGDPDTRRLQGRLRSIGGTAGGSAAAAGAKIPARSIRRTEGGSPLVRALEKIGNGPATSPKERRTPWLIVAAVGIVAAGVASYLGTKVIGAAVAPVCALAAHGVLRPAAVPGWRPRRYQTAPFPATARTPWA